MRHGRSESAISLRIFFLVQPGKCQMSCSLAFDRGGKNANSNGSGAMEAPR
jgi:hypothetical protein